MTPTAVKMPYLEDTVITENNWSQWVTVHRIDILSILNGGTEPTDTELTAKKKIYANGRGALDATR